MSPVKQIKISHSRGEYTVYAGEGVLNNINTLLDAAGSYDRRFIVSDSNVFPLYGKYIRHDGSFVFPAGESSKTLTTVAGLYESFHAGALTRSSLVIALGGGVTGDIAGFAASTYMRGVDFVQVPTSLLAQIDSSVGGKTGVDTSFGKNTVGAFYQPRAVFADSAALNTLPEDYYTDGLGEAVKYGCIMDAPLFNAFESGSPDRDVMIERCIRSKAAVVASDEHDRGIRAILNFGHTVGHAIEKCANYAGLSHGRAVAAGMVYAAAAGVLLNITPAEIPRRLVSLLSACRLPVKCNFSPSQLAAAVSGDKKREGDSINFILLRDIGNAVTVPVKISGLERLLIQAEELIGKIL